MKPQGTEKIFSSTTCLSKEQLLLYTKNELNAQDTHQAEIHLVDCELCSDALDGFALLNDTSILDETLAGVKQLTFPVSKPNTSFRFWLAAASLVFIIGLTQYFYSTLYERSPATLAEHAKSAKESPQNLIPTDLNKNEVEDTKHPDNNNNFKNTESKTEQANELNTADHTGSKNVVNKFVPPAVTEDATKAISLSASNGAIQSPAEKQILVSEALAAAPSSELEETPTVQAVPQKKAISRSSENTSYFSSDNKTRAGSNKKDKAEDYSISDQEGLKDHNEINIEQKNNLVSGGNLDVNHTALLDKGIQQFKMKDFKTACHIFDQVLKARNNDEKALLYGALSYSAAGENKTAISYLQTLLKNKNSSTYDEAAWNLALIYLKEYNNEAARLLLEELSAGKGLYMTKATEKLNRLK